MKPIAKIVSIVNRVVFFVTILILIFVSIFTIPRLFGVKPFVVLSGSMEPTIPTGSLVFVNTHDTNVAVDDVITFSLAVGSDKGVYVTHRVHAIDESGLIQTKGDNNNDPDGWLSKEAVTGTVVLHVPFLGLILDFLQNKGFLVVAGWVFLINVCTMICTRMLCGKEADK